MQGKAALPELTKQLLENDGWKDLPEKEKE